MSPLPVPYRLRQSWRNLRDAGARGLGSMLGNGVDAYWWTGRCNFGDLLTPYLLRSYGYLPVLTPPESCRLVSTGSILHHIPREYDGIVLGSGAITDEKPLGFPRATILALRGPKTRDLLGAPHNVALGDPGLLADRLVRPPSERRYEIGIVPHFEDGADPRIGELLRRHPRDICVIEVRREPRSVIREIGACRYILSSSLHGLVVGDTLGIPSAWLEFSDRVIGKGFKFLDYYAALEAARTPQTITGVESIQQLRAKTQSPPRSVPDTRENLHSLFADLRRHLQTKG